MEYLIRLFFLIAMLAKPGADTDRTHIVQPDPVVQADTQSLEEMSAWIDAEEEAIDAIGVELDKVEERLDAMKEEIDLLRYEIEVIDAAYPKLMPDSVRADRNEKVALISEIVDEYYAVVDEYQPVFDDRNARNRNRNDVIDEYHRLLDEEEN